MPRYGRTTAGVIPPPVSVNDGKFKDKQSQKLIDKIRKEHNSALYSNRKKEYNPKIDQQRIWSERSPASFEIPFESLGRDNFLNHPQVKNPRPLKKADKEK